MEKILKNNPKEIMEIHILNIFSRKRFLLLDNQKIDNSLKLVISWSTKEETAMEWAQLITKTNPKIFLSQDYQCTNIIMIGIIFSSRLRTLKDQATLLRFPENLILSLLEEKRFPNSLLTMNKKEDKQNNWKLEKNPNILWSWEKRLQTTRMLSRLCIQLVRAVSARYGKLNVKNRVKSMQWKKCRRPRLSTKSP